MEFGESGISRRIKLSEKISKFRFRKIPFRKIPFSVILVTDQVRIRQVLPPLQINYY